MIDALRQQIIALKAEKDAYTVAAKMLSRHAFEKATEMMQAEDALGRALSEQKPDGLASWELFIRVQREVFIREGSLQARTSEEQRQAAEGPCPIQELDCLRS